MRSRRHLTAAGLALATAGLALAGPAFGAGFGIFEQGSKAMGMAGAFTAQADDPSAIFHNPGGIAFQKERDFQVGFTWITSRDSNFRGAAPFPGEGVREELKSLSEFPPHFYWVEPVSDRLTFGLGVYAPFGLVTEWKNPDSFTGRFISVKGALTTVDIHPTIGWQATPNFGIGIGAIARLSEVELIQHIPAVNPFTNTVADVATIELTSDFDVGYGFSAGILHRVNESFSWGLSYRGKIEIDYSGDARLRQNLTGTPFDALVPAVLPLGRNLPVATKLEFPEMASVGVAVALTRNTLLEVDANWTGWSSFDELPVDFVRDDLPDDLRPQRWDDVNNYRIGLRWTAPSGAQWRIGYVYDETPQPEETVSPLLPDADRNGFTIGYGRQGQRFSFDVALMYLTFDDRTRGKSFPGEEASTYFGTYQNEGLLYGLTFGF